jgi:hypothetical protein
MSWHIRGASLAIAVGANAIAEASFVRLGVGLFASASQVEAKQCPSKYQ